MNTRFVMHGRPVFQITKEAGRFILRDILRDKTLATFVDETAAKQCERTLTAVFGRGSF